MFLLMNNKIVRNIMIADILPFSSESRRLNKIIKNKFKQTNDERFNVCKDRKSEKGRCVINLPEAVTVNRRP